jgi:hypothetical protein
MGAPPKGLADVKAGDELWVYDFTWSKARCEKARVTSIGTKWVHVEWPIDTGRPPTWTGRFSKVDGSGPTDSRQTARTDEQRKYAEVRTNLMAELRTGGIEFRLGYGDEFDNDALQRIMAAADGSLPDVAGRCPSCGGESLFLAHGGFVTCRRLDCAKPDEAAELLSAGDPNHYVVVDAMIRNARGDAPVVDAVPDWKITHPIRERAKGQPCKLTTALMEMVRLPETAHWQLAPGRYVATEGVDGGWLLERAD